GTVLGIMEAFRSIAEEGNPSFATVSGGLSAALVATAAGLAVAIPAVIFYNYFGRRIQSHLLETRYVLEHELAAAGKLTE
ncbi:MAG TPA: MotA/TolQ/ExbB proton channel family protein, partial [bacterium]|nr:MotA/TolQ/ExbB proton channel family protein [bacterium]